LQISPKSEQRFTGTVHVRPCGDSFAASSDNEFSQASVHQESIHSFDLNELSEK